MNQITPKGKDFRQLRESGMQPGSSRAIGGGFVTARNAIALGLIRLGVTPNHVSVAGFVANCGAAACLVVGAGHHSPAEAATEGLSQSYWPLYAAVWLFISSACDMLDGAVARLGNMSTPFGGMLDSTLDRLSDMALYLGMVIHFAVAGNITYVVLAGIALCNGVMISYTKARAEACIADCGVGFWQRGERNAAILLAGFSSHVPIMLWQQAVSPFFTFLRRVGYTRAALRAKQAGNEPPPKIPDHRWVNLIRPWRYPRGTIPYDLTVLFNIAFFVVLPWINPVFYGAADPLGDWLSTVLGPAIPSVS